ncbi:MAG TPA: AAA family ATPase [Solirubrobacteraceae bacterium]|nr:AAA family ATPase [Solirubrobacteraceae bacterium]
MTTAERGAPDTEGAPLNVADVLAESNVSNVLAELDEKLVALAPVKERISEIAALLVVDRLRKAVGLSSQRPSLHMSFTGEPGTGKTTVALEIAKILHGLGYIEKNQVVAVTRDDLVGQYVGHTAPKTTAVIKRARGGVLFIDEAYFLFRPDNERDYGAEAIEVLLTAMENERDTLVVVLAGYHDRMEQFFRSNPGMGSRVAHHIDFPNYTRDELLDIARLMLKHTSYKMTPEAEEAFASYVELRMKRPRFSNARSIRNALERARLRQAKRIFDEGGAPSREDLMTIEADDILASRVFGDDGEGEAQSMTDSELDEAVAASKSGD